ncbi:MAG: electron transfer flavoprotein subunit beta/FixA family protein [Candidatus Thermoplasmatota archaeon]
MITIVCAKQVVDVSEIKIDPHTKKPILQGLSKKISDIDKNALEEAIKIKEKNGGKIIVLCVGSPDAKERLKELLAMGADEAVLIPFEETFDYHMVAQLLAGAVKKLGSFDLILCGEASIDLFSGQIGPRLAGILNIPQITYAQKITTEKNKVTAERNMGENIVITESSYPVVITVTKEINTPRLPSLMQILGSAQKPIHEWNPQSLLQEKPVLTTKVVELSGISMHRKNIIFKDDLDQSVHKLVDCLIHEGVLR